jgi:type III secretory pathway component EscS
LVFAGLAALVPKCPLCVAAWLGVIGLSGLATRIDARALGFATALMAALSIAALSAAVGAVLIHRFSDRDMTNTKEGDEK